MGCQRHCQAHIRCHKARRFEFLWKILLLAAFSVLLSNSVKAQCESCHPLEVATYFHVPYENHQCNDCHEQKSNISNEDEVDLNKVKWFDHGQLFDGVSCILIPRPRQDKVLVFYVPELNKKFVLNPLNAKVLSYSYQPVLIKKVETCGIENGIWWEANICVKSNQPVELEISCSNLYEQKDYWSSFHQVTLAGLEKDKTYKCLVRARTIMGQEVERIFQFKVIKQDSPPLPKANNVSVFLYRLEGNDNLFVSVNTDGFIDWKLGELPGEPRLISAQNSSKHHEGNLNVSPNLCYRCHTDHKYKINHPMNVPLKENMKKTDLPLYNGLITCLSCHEPHVAKRPYLLRKESTGLCLSCHDDRYYK